MRKFVRQLARAAVVAVVVGGGVVAAPAARVQAVAPFVNLFGGGSGVDYGDNFGLYATLADPNFMAVVEDGYLTWTADGTPIAGCINRAVVIGSNYCQGDGTLAPGTYSVVANYHGSATWDDAWSAPIELRVFKINTDLTYTGPTTVAPSQPMVVSATLTRDVPAGPYAGQTVTFEFESSGGLCSDTTDANGVATCTLMGPPNNELLWISFAGDSTYTIAGAQPQITVTVPTTITLADPADRPWGQAITFGMSLTPAGVSGGTIDVTYGSGTPIAGCTDAAVTGSAVECTATGGLPPGTHQVVASYSGAGAYAASTSAPVTVTATRHGVSLAVTSASTATVGAPYSASGTVTDSVTSQPIAGASVTFQLGAASCIATSSAAGVAGCQLVPSAAGAPVLAMSTPQTAQYAAATTAESMSVGRGTTTTTLTGGDGVYNAPVTLTATVTPSDGGTVSFDRDGTALTGCEAVALVNDAGAWVATCASSSLSVGQHSFQASYSGSANYFGSSDTVTGTIAQAPTVVTYTGDTVAAVGETVNLWATLLQSGGGAVAGADLTFAWAGQQCTATTGAGGVATCTLQATGVDQTGQVIVQFDGDSNYLSSTSNPVAITVSPAATATTLQAPTDAVFSVPVDLVAVVTPSEAEGSVTFTDSGLEITGCSSIPVELVDAQLRATCSSVTLAPGAHTLAAVFSGNADYAGSTTPDLVMTVAPAATALLYAGDTEAAVGVPFSAAAILNNVALDPVAIAGQTVTFEWAGMSCTGTTDASGRAECTFTPTAVAQSGQIDVSFAGSSAYAAAGNDSNVTVTEGTSETVVTGPAAAPFGEPVTFTAVVTPAAVTGTVTFARGDEPLPGCESVALAEVEGQQQATCTATLPAGAITVTATYAGDVDYLGSSDHAPLTITPAATELEYLGDPLGTVAAPAVLGARLSALPNGGSLVAGETVHFAVGGLECSGVTGADGVASCVVTPTDLDQAGPVTVSFEGTSEYAPASLAGSLALDPTDTTTTLTGPSATDFGGAASFTATVSPSAGTGTVGFAVDGQPIAGCAAVAVEPAGDGWAAVCSTDALTLGTHSVQATYAGTASYLASTSDPVSIAVEAAPTELVYTGATSGTVGSPMVVSANLLTGHASNAFPFVQLLAPPGGVRGLAGETITFRLGDVVCVGVTNSSGTAACSLTPTAASDAVTLQVSYSGAATYLAVTVDVPIAVAPAAAPPSTPGATPGSPTLPTTGTQPGALVVLAAAAIAAGLVIRRVQRPA